MNDAVTIAVPTIPDWLWFIFGVLIAGFLATLVFRGTRRRRVGLLGSLMLGLLGAIIGSWMMAVLGVNMIGLGLLGTLFTAFLGAVLLVGALHIGRIV
jgi:uncharacterized membrane protein YeaQ/YmgE (transglycosylase-associated protein family)